MARFNRNDICTAYEQLEADYNVNGWLRERPSNQRRMESIGTQLHRIGWRRLTSYFKPMRKNAQAIYDAAVKRLGLPT